MNKAVEKKEKNFLNEKSEDYLYKRDLQQRKNKGYKQGFTIGRNSNPFS